MADPPDPLLTLQIGIGLPTLGERGRPGTLDAAGAARHVEALGFDFVDVADLIVGDGTPTLEATVALAAAAAVTDRVGIGYGVLALPLRPVAWVAAQVQALQHISGNRVLLGVGSGGLPDSPFWHAVAVAGRERGRRTDAALAVLARLIAGEPTRLPDLPGQPEVTLAPAAPVPPILVGGNSEAALRRAAPRRGLRRWLVSLPDHTRSVGGWRREAAPARRRPWPPRAGRLRRRPDHPN